MTAPYTGGSGGSGGYQSPLAGRRRLGAGGGTYQGGPQTLQPLNPQQPAPQGGQAQPTGARPMQQRTAQPTGPQAQAAPSPTFAELAAQGRARPAPPQFAPPQQPQAGTDPRVQGQTRDLVLQMLGQPSAYGSEQVQNTYQRLAADIDDEFSQSNTGLREEMARRGLADSSIQGGRLADLAVAKRSAKTDLADRLLDKQAQTQASDRAASLQAALGYSGQQFTQGLQGRQQSLAETLGLGNLDLDRQRFGESQYQYDTTLGANTLRDDKDRGLRETEFLGRLGLDSASLQNDAYQRGADRDVDIWGRQIDADLGNRRIDTDAALARDDLFLRVLDALGIGDGFDFLGNGGGGNAPTNNPTTPYQPQQPPAGNPNAPTGPGGTTGEPGGYFAAGGDPVSSILGPGYGSTPSTGTAGADTAPPPYTVPGLPAGYQPAAGIPGATQRPQPSFGGYNPFGGGFAIPQPQYGGRLALPDMSWLRGGTAGRPGYGYTGGTSANGGIPVTRPRVTAQNTQAGQFNLDPRTGTARGGVMQRGTPAYQQFEREYAITPQDPRFGEVISDLPAEYDPTLTGADFDRQWELRRSGAVHVPGVGWVSPQTAQRIQSEQSGVRYEGVDYDRELPAQLRALLGL